MGRTVAIGLQDFEQIIKNNDLFDQNSFLMDGDLLSKREKQFFDSVGPEMPEYIAAEAIRKLSEGLCRYYGKKNDHPAG